MLQWPHRVSSLLAAVELTRAAQRRGPDAVPLAARVLAGLDLLSIDAVVPAGMQVSSNLPRALDAIHLATAASITAELGALITFDRRMLAGAQAMDLHVLSPR